MLIVKYSMGSRNGNVDEKSDHIPQTTGTLVYRLEYRLDVEAEDFVDVGLKSTTTFILSKEPQLSKMAIAHGSKIQMPIR